MKLLMHMCCGPCSCYPTKKLREIGFEPVGYFFNPNIHPYQEWRRRLRTAREFTEKVNIKFFAENHYGLREFLSKVSSTINIEDSARNADGFHQRCKICYAWRLNEAAKFAENGKTPLMFVKGDELLGIIAVADVIKPDSTQAVKELQELGLHVVMLTGARPALSGGACSPPRR